MITPESPLAPKYWMYEQSGKLVPAVERFLTGKQPLSLDDFVLIKAYLTQWVDSPAWDENPHAGPDGALRLQRLRERIRISWSIDDLRQWVMEATDFGIDPL